MGIEIPVHTIPLVCPWCGADLDQHSGHVESPAPGDFSICVYCGRLLVYGAALGLRPPTAEEKAEFKRFLKEGRERG